MTGVAVGAASQTDLGTLLADQADSLLAAEAQAVQTVSWPLRSVLAAVEQQARARWIMAQRFDSDKTMLIVRRWIADQLHAAAAANLGPDSLVVPDLTRVARTGAALGRTHAAQQISTQTAPAPSTPLFEAGPRIEVRRITPKPAPAPGPPTEESPLVHAVADAARQTARARIQRAAAALPDVHTPTALSNALAIATRAPEDLGLAAQWLLHHTANAATREESIRAGARLLWIAERDACVVCLKLSGNVINALEGEGFDEDATFGPGRPPSVWPPDEPLMGPPRHPHCRCQTCVYFGVQAGQPDLAETLRREAKRSILRGFSKPSESQRTRIVAAERLLTNGAADMPKSVRAYAASAVKDGRFPTRAVPSRPASQPRRAA